MRNDLHFANLTRNFFLPAFKKDWDEAVKVDEDVGKEWEEDEEESGEAPLEVVLVEERDGGGDVGQDVQRLEEDVWSKKLWESIAMPENIFGPFRRLQSGKFVCKFEWMGLELESD